jgi:hypothetical protein
MSSGSKSYWNSRGYKRAPLSKDARLIDKIKNGDFDLSYFQTQILQAAAKFENFEKGFLSDFKGSAKDLEEAIGYYRRQNFKKIQRLTEKLVADEEAKLNELRTLLAEEFGQDWWDELSEKCTGGPADLYEMYRKKSQNEKANI